MDHGFESGALLGHLYTLERGSAVRLRLARTSDAHGIAELLRGEGFGAGDLDVGRLVHFDPRRRYVLCATGLIGATETLLGIGSIALDGAPAPKPDLVVLRPGAPTEVAQLLTSALIGRAGITRAA